MIRKDKFSMVIEEAIIKEQLGIFVWASWRTWDSFHLQYAYGTERHNELLDSLQQGKDFHVYHGLSSSLPDFFALPTKCLTEEAFFNSALACIEENHLKGPYILVPSMEFTDTLEEEDC